MIERYIKNRVIHLIESFTRKASTLFSIINSGLLLWGDGISPFCMNHYERLRYLEFRPFLNFKEGMVVYDVGANIGEMARFFSKYPSVSRIYCFEPVKETFMELVEKSKNYSRIKCFQVAVGDGNAIQRMNINDFSPSSSLLEMNACHVEEFPASENVNEAEVSIRTLEEMVRENKLPLPDFVKIDVQGFEDRVIQGGKNIIKNAKFCMLELSLISLYKDSLLITDINSLMRDLGFRLVNIVGRVTGKSGEILQLDGLYKNDQLA